MNDSTNIRKLDHVDIVANDDDADRRKYYFDDVRLIHRALPEIDLDQVDPSVEFMGKRLALPLLISSMTGGDHDVVRTINRNLAEAAEHCSLAMGVGSQRVMFTHPNSRDSFAVREYAPSTVIFANLGAVQLNLEFTIDQCREAVAVCAADALCLHLNPLQEAVQPEGDTCFAGLADKIAEVAEALEQPVILKEVGAGISAADAELAMASGVRYLDIAGAGGTSWSRIEHRRGDDADDAEGLGIVFQDWGIPTPLALKRLAPLRDRVTLIASGGVRNGIDMAKGIVLGATLCGMASPFLKPAMVSTEAVVAVIERIRREFVTAMFLLGAASVEEMQGNDALLADD